LYAATARSPPPSPDCGDTRRGNPLSTLMRFERGLRTGSCRLPTGSCKSRSRRRRRANARRWKTKAKRSKAWKTISARWSRRMTCNGRFPWGTSCSRSIASGSDEKMRKHAGWRSSCIATLTLQARWKEAIALTEEFCTSERACCQIEPPYLLNRREPWGNSARRWPGTSVFLRTPQGRTTIGRWSWLVVPWKCVRIRVLSGPLSAGALSSRRIGASARRP